MAKEKGDSMAGFDAANKIVTDTPPSPPAVDVYNPVSDVVRIEPARVRAQLKLTRANHVYFRRTLMLLRALGKTHLNYQQ